MISVIEELTVGDTVYVVVDTDRDLLYAAYRVVSLEYKGIQKYSSVLELVAPVNKKKRYFKPAVTLNGWKINLDTPHVKYKIYEDFSSMIDAFYNRLNRKPELNPKRLKKIKYLRQTHST